MSKALEYANALAPLASTLLGALGKLFGGASDDEAETIWRVVDAEIGTTRLRLDAIWLDWIKRDRDNDARVK